MARDENAAGGVSRRHALKVVAGAVAGLPALSDAAWAQALAVREQAAALPSSGLRFFSPAEYQAVDLLTELILPADDHSPGAGAARVADFIDYLLGDAAADEQETWRRGLAALDSAAQARWKTAFADSSIEQQTALLTEISAGEYSPKTPLERLFRQAKERTIQGYYTSEIGIHQDLRYKGNQFLDAFVGCTHPEHVE